MIIFFDLKMQTLFVYNYYYSSCCFYAILFYVFLYILDSKKRLKDVLQEFREGLHEGYDLEKVCIRYFPLNVE